MDENLQSFMKVNIPNDNDTKSLKSLMCVVIDIIHHKYLMRK
jgi:hypothetical protein